MKKINAVINISFDITRRCNMNCNFCCKGRSQEQDITKDIIDKTFDELHGNSIGVLRMFGGEPFLSPEMVEYIVDQIISRGVLVGHIQINTNGTILNPVIRDSLEKVTRYISDKYSKHEAKESIFCEVIVSTLKHDISDDEIESTLAYYNRNKVKGFQCRRDVENRNVAMQLALRGDALTNHKLLLSNPVSISQTRLRMNEFDFFEDFCCEKEGENNFSYFVFVDKSITISTNGDVYVGCSAPWVDINKLKMFNIMDCKSDFLQKISEFCWRYPINERIKMIREQCLTAEWCLKHGYQLADVDATTYRTLTLLVDISRKQEEIAKGLHDSYPDLIHTEVDTLASVQVAIELYELGFERKFVQMYLEFCTKLPQESSSPQLIQYRKDYIHKIYNRMSKMA